MIFYLEATWEDGAQQRPFESPYEAMHAAWRLLVRHPEAVVYVSAVRPDRPSKSLRVEMRRARG